MAAAAVFSIAYRKRFVKSVKHTAIRMIRDLTKRFILRTDATVKIIALLVQSTHLPQNISTAYGLYATR